jgi:hypothetical protein
MEFSILIGALGLLYVAIGAGVLIDADYYKNMLDELFNNRLVLYFLGIAMIFLGGLFVGVSKNSFDFINQFIFFIGILAMIKGVLILAWPKYFIRLSRKFEQKDSTLKISSVLVILIGLIIIYFGLSI